uniref:Olfactory receptor n=1 Tax=Chrysemys picta bellii TaxID=8478 RepID=A0A8C3IJ37_CHRPI
MTNSTTVVEFRLLGFHSLPGWQTLLFIVFLVIYILTITGNTVIILVVRLEPRLHSPMYSFLQNLSFLEIFYTSTIMPKMLSNLLVERKAITFAGCMAQLYCFVFLGATECFLLAVMAYDRYLAICYPLHYTVAMSDAMCMGLVALAWLGGFTHSAVQMGLLLQLPFCGPNVLDNFYCDVPQVIKLACTDTHVVELQMVFNGGVLLVVVFIILLISYIIILVKIRTHVTDGKHKALSTCGTQIAVVCLIFIPSIFIYARPFKKFILDKVVSVIYTVITPMLNPMIYTPRNAEMKNAIRRLISRMLFSGKKLKT